MLGKASQNGVHFLFAPQSPKNVFQILKNLLSEKYTPGVPGWLSQLSVQLLIWAQAMISGFLSLSPTSGPVLTSQSLEPALDSASPSLSDYPPLTICLFLFQK